jgi:hypothetical protein
LHRFTRSEPIREKGPHLSARLSGWLVKGAFTLCQFLMGQVLTGKSRRTRSVGTSTSAVGIKHGNSTAAGSSAGNRCYLA